MTIVKGSENLFKGFSQGPWQGGWQKLNITLGFVFISLVKPSPLESICQSFYYAAEVCPM